MRGIDGQRGENRKHPLHELRFEPGAVGLGQVNKFLEPVAGAVLAKIAVLVFIILFIQKRPQGLFALKGRSAEA